MNSIVMRYRFRLSPSFSRAILETVSFTPENAVSPVNISSGLLEPINSAFLQPERVLTALGGIWCKLRPYLVSAGMFSAKYPAPIAASCSVRFA